MTKTRPTLEKAATQTPDLLKERLSEAKKLLPEAFSEGRIDVDKLKKALGDLADDRPERYTFSWAGKRDAIRLLQIPAQGTLVPDKAQSVDFDKTSNMIIEGDNLEVLKLLYKSYFGKVKMIYIDPPYNTGNDFVYPDDYTDPLGNYLAITGQKDGDGNLLTSNPESNGRFHSSWLSMMYPRLFVARQLLSENGVIFVSIDDTEAHDLRMIMNEIFGEENFVDCVVWQKKVTPSNDSKFFSNDHDYLLIYAKEKTPGVINRLGRTEKHNEYYKNPDDDPRGPWNSAAATCNKSKSQRPNLYYEIENPFTKEKIWPKETAVWAHSKESFAELIKEKRVYWGKDGNSKSPRIKLYLDEAGTVVPRNVWLYSEAGNTQSATTELLELLPEGVFSYPKPTKLIKKILELTTTPSADDIILDFFAGSGTTAQTVLEQNAEDGGNRKFILVQLPEPTPEKSEARKAGYKTISDICMERVRRAIKKVKKESGQEKLGEKKTLDLGFKAFTLVESNFKAWKGVEGKDAKKYTEQMALYVDPLKQKWKAEDVIWEVALKEGFGLCSTIEKLAHKENTIYKVTEPQKQQSFLICLDGELKATAVRALNLKKDDLFFCRDAALSDELAANLALQCRLKTI